MSSIPRTRTMASARATTPPAAAAARATTRASATPRAKAKPTTGARAPDPRAIWRQETMRQARKLHEDAYFLHVVCPLAAKGYPRPKPEALLIPGRKYRFDFAYLEARLAVEIQGQIWHKGGHTSGYGVSRDADKAGELACIGWRFLPITPEMIADGRALDRTERALRHAGLRGAA